LVDSCLLGFRKRMPGGAPVVLSFDPAVRLDTDWSFGGRKCLDRHIEATQYLGIDFIYFREKVDLRTISMRILWATHLSINIAVEKDPEIVEESLVYWLRKVGGEDGVFSLVKVLEVPKLSGPVKAWIRLCLPVTRFVRSFGLRHHSLFPGTIVDCHHPGINPEK